MVGGTLVSDIYWNVRKKVFSVREKGLVTDHVESVYIDSPRFVVSEAGRQRVLKNKQKNVHAFVRGAVLENSKETRSRFYIDNRINSDYSFAVYDPYDDCGCFRVLCVIGEFLMEGENSIENDIKMVHAYVYDGKPQLKVKMHE